MVHFFQLCDTRLRASRTQHIGDKHRDPEEIQLRRWDLHMARNRERAKHDLNQRPATPRITAASQTIVARRIAAMSSETGIGSETAVMLTIIDPSATGAFCPLQILIAQMPWTPPR